MMQQQFWAGRFFGWQPLWQSQLQQQWQNPKQQLQKLGVDTNRIEQKVENDAADVVIETPEDIMKRAMNIKEAKWFGRDESLYHSLRIAKSRWHQVEWTDLDEMLEIYGDRTWLQHHKWIREEQPNREVEQPQEQIEQEKGNLLQQAWQDIDWSSNPYSTWLKSLASIWRGIQSVGEAVNPASYWFDMWFSWDDEEWSEILSRPEWFRDAASKIPQAIRKLGWHWVDAVPNLPWSTVKLLWEFVEMAWEAPEMVKWAYKLYKWHVDYNFDRNTEDRELFENFASMLYEWGKELKENPGKLFNAMEEHPAAVMSIVAPQSTAKMVEKWARKTQEIASASARSAETLATTVWANFNKVSPELVRGAFSESLRSKSSLKSFVKWLNNEITDVEILRMAKSARENMNNNLRGIYWGKNYDKLQKNQTQIDISDIIQDVNNDLINQRVDIKWLYAALGKKNIDDLTSSDINRFFEQSRITKPQARLEIAKTVKDLNEFPIKSIDGLTPRGLDFLKQRINDRYSTAEWMWKSNRYSTMSAQRIKDKISNEIPEYAAMTKQYEQTINQIKEVEKLFSLWDRANTQTAINKLWQLFRKNQEYKQQTINLLDDAGKINIKAALAWKQLKEWQPDWLVGFMMGSAALWAAAWTLPLKTLLLLPLTSPRILGKTAASLWVSKHKLSDWVEKLAKWLKIMEKRYNLNLNDLGVGPAIRNRQRIQRTWEDIIRLTPAVQALSPEAVEEPNQVEQERIFPAE